MIRVIVGAMILALAAPALADTPSYSYINANIYKADIDDSDLDLDGDGFGVGGSVELAENWHIVGGYSTLDFGFGVDLNQLSIGAGYHTDISPTTAMHADLSYVKAEVDAGVLGSVDESGYGLRVGIRSNVSEKVELEGNLAYTDLGDGADGTSIGGAFWYKFTETFALGLGATVDEDVTQYGIGARLYF